ncbi:PEP-CTERM sorting domain-containing protein [Massilia sp. UMI-21]|nr:PEP-CTERM sorting domain-containing protein [Massilia sp. UMI-21]
MHIQSLLRAAVATTVFAVASFANAGVLSAPSSWTASGDADATAITATASGVEMFYSRGTYFCAGCGNNYFTFSAAVDNTGSGGFDFSYNAFNGWFMAGSDLTILVNDIAVASYGGDNIHNSFSYAFTAGDILSLRAHETNGDSQPYIDGRIMLSNFSGALAANDVPEPASLALVGLGLLGAAAARRKSAQAK